MHFSRYIRHICCIQWVYKLKWFSCIFYIRNLRNIKGFVFSMFASVRNWCRQKCYNWGSKFVPFTTEWNEFSFFFVFLHLLDSQHTVYSKHGLEPKHCFNIQKEVTRFNQYSIFITLNGSRKKCLSLLFAIFARFITLGIFGA